MIYLLLTLILITLVFGRTAGCLATLLALGGFIFILAVLVQALGASA